MNRGDLGCYLGVDADGLVVAVCVDNPERRKDVAEFVADTINDGYTVARCKVADLWEGRVTLGEKMPTALNKEPKP